MCLQIVKARLCFIISVNATQYISLTARISGHFHICNRKISPIPCPGGATPPLRLEGPDNIHVSAQMCNTHTHTHTHSISDELTQKTRFIKGREKGRDAECVWGGLECRRRTLVVVDRNTHTRKRNAPRTRSHKVHHSPLRVLFISDL